MANIKISAMPVLATMNDTALIPVVDGSTNKRITGLVAKTYTSASPTLTGTPSSTGIFTINYVGSADSSLVIAGSNTRGGAGYHDFLVVKNGAAGATNTNKSFRLNSTGGFEILDSAYSVTLLELSDGGQLTVRGSAVLNLNSASPSITTTGSTASVFNTNALTGNLFGAATTIGIGAATGTLTLNNATVTTPGQLISTRAGALTDGAGQLYLNGATGNRIDWNTNGTGAPAFTTRSVGSKIVLYPLTNATNTDYAIGIDSGTFWASVPQNDTALKFKWYGGITEIASIDGIGNQILTGDLAVNGGDITTSQTTFNLLNTTATTVNFAGAATTIGIGAATGTLTIGNVTITGTNATTFNMNGASPSIVTSSTGTASVFNTNALTVNAFNAATTATLVNSATTLGIGNTATAAQTANMFTASTGASTYNFATGATTSGSTKSINIGTNGVSGSTTNIAIGSTVSGATSNLTFGGTLADATTTSTAKSVGYLGMPQQSKSSAYTTVIGDSGKHIYITATATITIDSNATVAYPIGTTITFIAGSGATATIAITSDTMYLAGAGTTGSRTLAPFGMATAVKVASTTWFINGTGLT
jgi:hypothetical protein